MIRGKFVNNYYLFVAFEFVVWDQFVSYCYDTWEEETPEKEYVFRTALSWKNLPSMVCTASDRFRLFESNSFSRNKTISTYQI